MVLTDALAFSNHVLVSKFYPMRGPPIWSWTQMILNKAEKSLLQDAGNVNAKLQISSISSRMVSMWWETVWWRLGQALGYCHPSRWKWMSPLLTQPLWYPAGGASWPISWLFIFWSYLLEMKTGTLNTIKKCPSFFRIKSNYVFMDSWAEMIA